jgi:hypothetical protein
MSLLDSADKLPQNIDKVNDFYNETDGPLKELGLRPKSDSDTHLRNFRKGLHKNFGQVNDPTFLGFTLLFHWESSPLFKGGGSLESENDTPSYPNNSALKFLHDMEEFRRESYLKTFIKHLKYLNQHMPWYWQGITGLDTSWQKYNDFSDPYRGGDDSKITLDCLESVDLKVTGMIDLYQKAVRDYQYTRKLLTSNLITFDLDIYVEEIRQFNTFSNFITNISNYSFDDSSSMKEKLKEAIRKHTNRIVISLKNCEFLPEESGTVFESVSNVAGEQAKQRLTIQYEDVYIRAAVPWLNYEITENNSARDQLRDITGGRFDADRIERGAFNTAQQLAKRQGRRFVQSNLFKPTGLNPNNVHGVAQRAVNLLSNSNIEGFFNASEDAYRAVVKKLRQDEEKLGRAWEDVPSKEIGDLGNVHE